MATNITGRGDLASGFGRGMANANKTSGVKAANSSGLTWAEFSLAKNVFSTAVHGQMTVELIDNAGTVAATLRMKTSDYAGGNLAELRYQSGQAAADNGSTSIKMKRYVDTASYSTARLRITLSGSLTDSTSDRFRASIADSDGLGDFTDFAVFNPSGNGWTQFEIPFEVKDV